MCTYLLTISCIDIGGAHLKRSEVLNVNEVAKN